MSAPGTLTENRVAAYVRGTFGHEPTEASAEFLREIRSIWREVTVRSRRLVFVVILLVALFFLLESASVTEIAFAGVKLAPSAIDAISIALPALVAYLYSEYWGLFVLAERYEELHDEVCHQLYPELGPLQSALHPQDTMTFGSYSFLTIARDSNSTFLTTATTVTSIAVIFLAPSVFLIASYVMLIGDFGVAKIEMAISLLFSIFCVARVVGFWSIN